MAMGCLRGLRARQCISGARLFIASAPLHTAQLIGVPRAWSARGGQSSGPGGLTRASSDFRTSNICNRERHMCSDISALPKLLDPQAQKALNELLATNWYKIDKKVWEDVEAAIAKSGDEGGVLSTVWSSARASEKFAETLIALRMELDDLSGSGGEDVRQLPDATLRGLESAFTKYHEYLEAIDGESEVFLKKKVQNDLGSLLVQIKQRCSGLDPKWGNITLLGTSGLSGSYIERRS